LLVQPRQHIEAEALLLRSYASRSLQIDNRIVGGSEWSALKRGRQEARLPVVRAAERAAAHVLQDDESRQGRIFRPQAVCDPASHTGETHAELPGLHFEGRLHMVVGSPPPSA